MVCQRGALFKGVCHGEGASFYVFVYNLYQPRWSMTRLHAIIQLWHTGFRLLKRKNAATMRLSTLSCARGETPIRILESCDSPRGDSTQTRGRLRGRNQEYWAKRNFRNYVSPSRLYLGRTRRTNHRARRIERCWKDNASSLLGWVVQTYCWRNQSPWRLRARVISCAGTNRIRRARRSSLRSPVSKVNGFIDRQVK